MTERVLPALAFMGVLLSVQCGAVLAFALFMQGRDEQGRTR